MGLVARGECKPYNVSLPPQPLAASYRYIVEQRDRGLPTTLSSLKGSNMRRHASLFYRIILLGIGPVLLAAVLILAWSLFDVAAAQEETSPSEVQKTINILEDEERRKEIITLLKLLAVVEEERGEQVPPHLGQAAPPETDPGQKKGLRPGSAGSVTISGEI